MKAFNLLNVVFIPIIATALSGIGINKSTQTRPDSIFPSPLDLSSRIENKVNTGIENSNSPDWQSDVHEKMKYDEYKISFDDELKSYQAPNRANNIRYIFHNDGYTARTLSNSIPVEEYRTNLEWNVEIRLIELKHEKNESIYFTGKEFIPNKNRACIEDENIRIEYLNDDKGMRQDFIIKNRSDIEGNLRLNLSADTKLTMEVGRDAVIFKNIGGSEIMKYSSLKCFDINGKILNAHFEENEELQITNYKLQLENQKSRLRYSKSEKTNPESSISNSRSFSIVVDDRDAVYPITIDPLSTSPDWTAESNQASSSFGISVATAGDVNGDGYSDVIIGAQKFDGGQNNEGKVFVYYGSAIGLSPTPNWTAESNQAEAFFGHSVATAGDVNGDGYSDVIIGAQVYDNGQTDEGRAFVYHGSSSGLSSTPNWTGESNQAGAQYGISVATTGDVNNDGYSDVIVGAWLYSNGQTEEGKAFVYHGSSSGLSSTANWSYESNQADANFGWSVAWAGDVNGNGYSDAIIGAYKYDNGQANEGAAFLFYGSPSGLIATHSWLGQSNQAEAYYGYSVSGAGDVNGDGYSDLLVGANSFNQTQTDEGKVYLYYGNSVLPSTAPAWYILGNFESSSLGNTVSTAGDINGDGYGDVILGAAYYDNTELNEGAVFVFYGSTSGLSESHDWSFEGNQTGAYVGTSVATAGDVNGDGFSDIITGAYSYSSGETDEGKTFLFYGSARKISSSVSWQSIGQSQSQYGSSVSNAGDVNGDGYIDVIIGSPYYSNGHTYEGRVDVYYGGSSGPSLTSNWSAESNLTNSYFGSTVSTAGDVNGDGYADVIVCAPNQTGIGRVYVYYGSSAGLSGSSSWTVQSASSGDYFGRSASFAGDINGDGYSDIVIGAPKHTNTYTLEGKLYVYYGSPAGLPSLPSWTQEGQSPDAALGLSVSGAGDVNGDGFSDVMAYWYQFPISGGGVPFEHVKFYEGSSYGLRGSGSVSNYGNSYGFGTSLCSSGDINGDGYSDILIASPYYSSSRGKVEAFYGSSIGISVIPVWTKFGSNNSLFGRSVSSAGDINGDGYSDIIVGAPGYDTYFPGEGKSFVYTGSPSGLSASEIWSMNGTPFNPDHVGASVSGGDVNGDGFSDVITGVSNFQSAGKTVINFGNSSTGIRVRVRQYKPASGNFLYAGGLTGSVGSVRFNFFGKSFFGRSNGRLVYEFKENGMPFSGSVITNSVLHSGTGTLSNLGITGADLSKDVTGIEPSREYHWRSRVQFSIPESPFQKLGPWRYFNNFIANPFAGFKPNNTPLISPCILRLNLLIQGFYNNGIDQMSEDTVSVCLRAGSAPYTILDSAVSVIDLFGIGIFEFSNAVSGTGYYLQIKHRNSIETWSSAPLSFISGNFSSDMTYSKSAAYGNNLTQVDAFPVEFGVFSGDQNQDGFVNLTDIINVYNAARTFTTGYLSTDMTGDNLTDLTDLVLTYNNASTFVSVKKP